MMNARRHRIAYPARAGEGLCFQRAIQEAREGGTVVHAMVRSPAAKKRFWHAWVERGGRVCDNTECRLPVKKFYSLLRPTRVRRYKDYEAQVYVLRTGHYGPWEPDEAGPKPRAPTRR